MYTNKYIVLIAIEIFMGECQHLHPFSFFFLLFSSVKKRKSQKILFKVIIMKVILTMTTLNHLASQAMNLIQVDSN